MGGVALGEGGPVRFWVDECLDGMCMLLKHATGEVRDAELGNTVNDYLTADGSWHWTWFHDKLPVNVCLQIVGYIPPRPAGGADEVIWMTSTSGSCTVISA